MECSTDQRERKFYATIKLTTVNGAIKSIKIKLANLPRKMSVKLSGLYIDFCHGKHDESDLDSHIVFKLSIDGATKMW